MTQQQTESNDYYETQFLNIKAKLTELNSALQPGCRLYYLDDPRDFTPEEIGDFSRMKDLLSSKAKGYYDGTGRLVSPSEDEVDQLRLKYDQYVLQEAQFQELYNKVAHAYSYLVILSKKNPSQLYWISNDAGFLSKDRLKSDIQIAINKNPKKLENDEPSMVELTEEDARALSGDHLRQKKRGFVNQYFLDKKVLRHNVSAFYAEERNNLQSIVEKSILARSNYTFDVVIKQLALQMEDKKYASMKPHIKQLIAFAIEYKKSNKMPLNELVKVLEETIALLEPKSKNELRFSSVSSYYALSQEVYGKPHRTGAEIGSLMMMIGLTALFIGLLYLAIGFINTAPSAAIVFHLGQMFATGGTVTAVSGFGLFSVADRSTDLSRTMKDIDQEYKNACKLV